MINKVLIRFFDVILAATGIIILMPVFVTISIIIICESEGGAFYRQTRIGKNYKAFHLYKFRSMYPDSARKGLLTIGKRDPRITGTGQFLRASKLDELPQMFNVLLGDMSMVGPRPEVRKYVQLYNPEQRKILSIRPGITDLASIYYASENEILGRSGDPENMYINVIMPEKIRLNLIYLENHNPVHYFRIIFKTVVHVVLRRRQGVI